MPCSHSASERMIYRACFPEAELPGREFLVESAPPRSARPAWGRNSGYSRSRPGSLEWPLSKQMVHLRLSDQIPSLLDARPAPRILAQ